MKLEITLELKDEFSIKIKKMNSSTIKIKINKVTK